MPETHRKDKLESSPCQRNVLGMMLNQYVKDLAVVRNPLRERDEPFPSFTLLCAGPVIIVLSRTQQIPLDLKH